MLQEEEKWKQSIVIWNFFLHLFMMKLKKKNPNMNLTFWNQHEFTNYVKQTIKRFSHYVNANEKSKASCKKAWEILCGKDIPDYPDPEGTTSHETLPFQSGDQETASETDRLRFFLRNTFWSYHLLWLNVLQIAMTIQAGEQRKPSIQATELEFYMGRSTWGVFNLE